MRAMPSERSSSAASGLEAVICVDAWTSSPGQIVRASIATAGSCTMMASTPAAATRRISSSTIGSSGSNTSVLSVT
jgi:hypothetical protein